MVLQHETMTKLHIFVFLFDLNNKLNDPIVVSLVRNGLHVFNHINNHGEILYGSVVKLPILKVLLIYNHTQ